MTEVVHILGVGNIGLLLAHRLAESHGADVVNFLFHRHSLAHEWNEAGRRTELVDNGIRSTQEGYGTQVVEPLDIHDINPIDNLVIATKATNTVAALKSIHPRLTPQSTVLFCQNGMGIMDELRSMYQDVSPECRPNFMAAIVSHGVYSTNPFRVVHAGHGTVTMGSIGYGPQAHTGLASPTEFLSDLLCRTPALAAVRVSTLQLLQAQLEKLIANAIINPLTVIFNCRNGELFCNSQQADSSPRDMNRGPAFQLMHLLLKEIGQVLQALPEAQGLSGKEELFSVPRMKEVVIGIADRTGKNTSSMLQDFRAKKTTEIDYINGYVVRKGRELGINCGVNERVVRVVKAGRMVDMTEILEVFPELSGPLPVLD